jgi:hypothetical protein
MRTALVLLGLAVFAGGMALPQANSTTAAKKKSSTTTGKTVSPKTAPATSATRKTATTTKTAGKTAPKTTTAGKTTKSAKKGVPAAPRRYGPTTPTPERYRDIQSALAEKGYLKTEPNGVWDDDYVDAMKRFQEDKNISATGKITASALIGLGLGPKTDADPVVAPVVTPPVTPPVPDPQP